MFCALLQFEKIDKRNCIMFCVNNDIKYARTFEIVTVAFGESIVSRTQLQLSNKRFKKGQEYVGLS